jgi:hypothetical protein
MFRQLILLLPLLILATGCEQRPNSQAVDTATATPSTTATPTQATTTTPNVPKVENTTGRIGLGEPYTLGHIRVTVKKASVGKVPLKQTDGSIAYSEEPRLMILLRIENISDKRQSPYNTWVPDLDAAKTVANLVDNSNAELKRVTLGFGNNVKDRTTLDTLSPGKVIADLLLFEVPNPKAAHVNLDLPGANCGARGTFQFRIPASAIGR